MKEQLEKHEPKQNTDVLRFEDTIKAFGDKSILYVTDSEAVHALKAKNVTTIAHTDYRPEMMYAFQTTIFDK